MQELVEVRKDEVGVNVDNSPGSCLELLDVPDVQDSKSGFQNMTLNIGGVKFVKDAP